MPEHMRRIIGPTDTGELSGRVGDIIERYGLLCSLQRRELEETFAPAELDALCDAIWSTMFRPADTLIDGVLADFEDSQADGLYEKWQVDGTAVKAKLQKLDIGRQIALVDLLERRKRRMAGEEE
jgi:hypothetical protein